MENKNVMSEQKNKPMTASEWFDTWGTPNQLWNMTEFAKHVLSTSKPPANVEDAINGWVFINGYIAITDARQGIVDKQNALLTEAALFGYSLNGSDAVEFAEWILSNEKVKRSSSIKKPWTDDVELYTTEQLYAIFTTHKVNHD